MVAHLQSGLVAMEYFVGITGSEDVQSGDGTASGKVFDGLVGRSVFSKSDRVVGHDIEDRLVHDAAQSHGGAHVVGEDEEGSAVGSQAAEAHAVEDRGHCVFADTEVHISA